MKGRNRWSRLTAMILVIAMIFTSQPVSVLAETIIGAGTPGELSTIGTEVPIINAPTYNLADHPGWIQKWDGEKGSYVKIKSGDTKQKEMFLPHDPVEGVPDEFKVGDGYATEVEVYWSVPEGSAFSPVKNGTKFTYQLPTDITFAVGQKFPVTSASGVVIGTGTVGADGLVTIEVTTSDGTELHNFSAHFGLTGTLSLKEKKVGDEVELHFPELGDRKVTIFEESSSNPLGFKVGKGLANVEQRDWGANTLEDAVIYDEGTGLIKTIWYIVSVTANETNTANLTELLFDDVMKGLEGGGEGSLDQYFHIRASEAEAVTVQRGNLYIPVELKAESGFVTGDRESSAHFQFDLSKLKNEYFDDKGLQPGDRLVIKYPVDVDPEFWLKISGEGASGREVELSGVYSATNSITVSNGAGTEQEAKNTWSMQKEWLNKKGTVRMIGGEPYVHYEIYVYPTVSKSL